MVPLPVCVVPPARVMTEKMYVFLLVDGEWQEGWIARPTGVLDLFIGADQKFYFSKVTGNDGAGISLYRSEIVAEDQEPTLETIRVSDIDLPTHLNEFASSFSRPNIIWTDQAAALIGVGNYSYNSGGTVNNGVVFSAGPTGTQSVAEIFEGASPFGLFNLAIEFEDGSFATCDWGVTS